MLWAGLQQIQPHLCLIHLKCMEEEMAYPELQKCSGCKSPRLVGFRTELSDGQALRMGNSHLPLMFNVHSDEDTVSESLSLRLFWVHPTFVLGQASMLFMLALGNSSANEKFSPIKSSWQDALIPLLPVGFHISQKARMQFTLFVACHCGRKSGY